jgi:hypothetical protein
MSKHEFDTTDTKRYTLTIFLSFVIVFLFLILMSQCHGNYIKVHEQNVVSEFND